jgi:flagellar basal-body rod protein FlgF
VQSEPYVALSAQTTLEKRMTSIALNVANINTVGYRGAGVNFGTYVVQNGEDPVAYATKGKDYISQTQGPLIKTGNPLDMAVQGDGYFAIQTPAGTAYTRDGRMQLTPGGAVQTVNGYPILDAGGAPLQLDPNGGEVAIARDGMITQGGRQLGAVGLYEMPPGANFTRVDNSAVIPDKDATPILAFDNNGVIQGHVEGSNVNPVLEMAKMMTISRAIESISNAAQSNESTLKDAIKTLGDNNS